MSGVTRKQLLRMLAEQTTNYVLMDSTKRAIERMAEDFARETMDDPVWRQRIREEVQRASKLAAAGLERFYAEEAAEAAHSGRKRSPRKTKRKRPGTRASRTS